jgi:hypothetical protein
MAMAISATQQPEWILRVSMCVIESDCAATHGASTSVIYIPSHARREVSFCKWTRQKLTGGNLLLSLRFGRYRNKAQSTPRECAIHAPQHRDGYL